MKPQLSSFASAFILSVALSSAALAADVSLNGQGYVYLENEASTFTAPSYSSNNRFWWVPQKAALRFGAGSNWSMANIGLGSFAAGYSVTASGSYSFAMGNQSSATGGASAAFGPYSLASGDGTFAGGDSAMAAGFGSVALGYGATSYGENAVAFGNGVAGGDFSFAAMGWASGVGSVALGAHSYASGDYSTAVNGSSTASSYSLSLGRFNINKKRDGVTTPNPNAPSSDDPVFEVGIGTASNNRANALTVFRDGTVRLAKASGGISMGQFQ